MPWKEKPRREDESSAIFKNFFSENVPASGGVFLNNIDSVTGARIPKNLNSDHRERSDSLS